MQFGTHNDLKNKLWWKERFEREDCPLCRDIEKSSNMLWKGEYWTILYNLYPYIAWWKHIMLVPIEHYCYSYDISAIEYTELTLAEKYIKEFFGEEWYFSFTRESMAERSVEHLHTHYIPGKLKRRTLTEMLIEQGFEWME